MDFVGQTVIGVISSFLQPKISHPFRSATEWRVSNANKIMLKASFLSAWFARQAYESVPYKLERGIHGGFTGKLVSEAQRTKFSPTAYLYSCGGFLPAAS